MFQKCLVEHLLKLEPNPLNPDQVGCSSNASGTGVLVLHAEIMRRVSFKIKYSESGETESQTLRKSWIIFTL